MRIRTRIAVTGFNASEVDEGLPYLMEYLGDRPWLLNPNAAWEADQNRLVVVIETEGDDPDLEAKGTFDEVWDCVIAAISFSSKEIHFDILEAQSIV